MLELVFVMAPGQNLFFRELVDAIRHELDALGVPSALSEAGFPDALPERVYVLVPPHEWFRLDPRHPAPDLLRRTVFICAEQPGTSHWHENLELSRRAGAVFDINRHSAAELTRRGVAAEPFPLGYCSRWAEQAAPLEERDVDVLFMGAVSERRLRFLASYADVFWKWRTRFVLSDNARPNAKASASFLADADKWRLLGRSKILLNLHQGPRPYFEWLRVVQAIHSGCAVVSEHSTDFAPLRPSHDILVGRPETLAMLSEALLEGGERLRTITASALELLRTSLPLRRAVERLVAVAEGLASGTAEPAPPAPPLLEAPPPLPRPGGEASAPEPPEDREAAGLAVLRAALKDVRLDLLDLRRELDARGEGSGAVRARTLEIAHRSASWSAKPGRVSVLTTVFDYGHHIEAALDSVAHGNYRELELVVVDDNSRDDSLERVRSWIDRHPGVPALLLHHPLNRGLPASRNTALGFARGELCFVLDADNEIYPGGLHALVRALDDRPEVVFAYGMLQRFSSSGPVDLMGYFPWDHELLRRGNYIDAMALVRTASLRELGGYTTDRRLHGWEDYDLWCHVAESGGAGVLVPEVVGRYRVTGHSMLSLTNLSLSGATSVLRERYPRLMAHRS